MKTFKICAVTLAMASSPLLAHAELSSRDSSFGAKSTVYDSSTDLLWLSLTKTQNTPYSAVSSNLGTGGAFEGWRFATIEEWRNLYRQFGFDVSSNKYISEPSAEEFKAMDASVALLGNLSQTGDSRDKFQGGLVADGSSATGYSLVYYSYDACLAPSGECTPGPGASSYGAYFGAPLSYSLAGWPIGGSYLVKASAVPEPSAALIFVMGLMVCGLYRRNT